MAKKIEALADSIAFVNQFHVPESKAYSLRNPGLLKAGSIDKMAQANDENLRIFSSHIGGYKALVDSLAFKCQRFKLVSLSELYTAYGVKTGKLFEALDFLQRALQDDSIEHVTPAGFFLEIKTG